jgi:hypothetical protein
MARQRFSYGRSAPLLERRHPGAATPLHAAPATVAIWLAGAVWGPAAAAAGLAASAFAASNAANPHSRRLVATLVADGHLHATRHLARLLVREWLPLTALACVRSRRARRIAVAAFALDAIASRGREPEGSGVLAHLALRAVDNASYAAGLWRAAVAGRSVAALRLRFVRSGATGA